MYAVALACYIVLTVKANCSLVSLAAVLEKPDEKNMFRKKLINFSFSFVILLGEYYFPVFENCKNQSKNYHLFSQSLFLLQSAERVKRC